MTKKLDEEHLLLIQQLRDEFAENSNVVETIQFAYLCCKKKLTN